ncbi:MAG: hypothetical protein ALAOOOJD_03428 [bacterium]|nr:hypothetical protein [bacterium]
MYEANRPKALTPRQNGFLGAEFFIFIFTVEGRRHAVFLSSFVVNIKFYFRKMLLFRTARALNSVSENKFARIEQIS